jgi:hypothetical protein
MSNTRDEKWRKFERYGPDQGAESPVWAALTDYAECEVGITFEGEVFWADCTLETCNFLVNDICIVSVEFDTDIGGVAIHDFTITTKRGS